MSFTAKDVKDYVLGLEGSNEKWYAIESGMYVPNENYNPEHGAEASRLYNEWANNRNYGRVSDRVMSGPTRQESYDAYCTYRAAHEETSREEKNVPFVFKHNGVEYPVIIVSDDSGGEGHGEYCSMIYEIDGRFFKLEGSYYSHDGMYWDDDSFTEVKPQVKSVTVYE